jgi:CRP-like cAMP-binding protein
MQRILITPLDELSFTLRLSPLFSGLAEGELREIAVMAQWRDVEEGERLFAAGDPCEAIYLVKAGLVKLYVLGPRGRQKVIEFVQPGDSFAEAAMFSGQGYPVNAMAIAPARLVGVDAFSLSRYLRAHPEMAWNMMAQMSRRLHQLIGQVRSMTLHNAEQRLAQFLLQGYDAGDPQSAVVELPSSRADLALALNVTPETLCRTLGKFKQAGWVGADKGRLVIHDAAGLANLLR